MANTQRQSTEVSKKTQANTAAVETLMNQQLQVQMSMDASLKNIDVGIQQLAQTMNGFGQGQQPEAKPSTSSPTPKRAEATKATLAPVRFHRRNSG